MKIAISKASGSPSYENYGRWLTSIDPDIEIVDLMTTPDPEVALQRLSECSGLLISGGPDVDPEHYGQPEKRELCGPIDAVRDTLELALAREGVRRNMPILGICRGAQVLNVAFGGTLVADIPTAIGRDVEHGRVNDTDARHHVDIEPGSLIKRYARVLDGEINSAHHQAVEHLASAFAVAAVAPDGTIEAFEPADTTVGGRPFILGVQWHPERMEADNPLSTPIAEHFLHEVAAYHFLFQR